jgi:hypothetical protein
MNPMAVFVVGSLLALLIAVAPPASAQPSDTGDPGWPRVFVAGDKRLTVYQPQIDSWINYATIQFRCAIAVRDGAKAEERYGVVEVVAATSVDSANRQVMTHSAHRDIRFANIPDDEAARLRDTVNMLYPPRGTTAVSLDRVLAYLDMQQQKKQPAVEVNLQPPKIFYSSTPAILLMFLGKPEFKPVAAGRTDLMFAVNANWDILFDTAGQKYYLLYDTGWLATSDPLNGSWTTARSLPKVLSTLPADENWEEVRRNIPGQAGKKAPKVFVAAEPAEMLLTDGEPTYTPISGTHLLRVANSESPLFLHSAEKQYYFMAAGRWFRAAALNGSWSPASTDLPVDFANIPEDDEAAFVKAAVPGTREASDAVLLSSIPTTTAVSDKTTSEKVVYDGNPSFAPIEGTTVKYATNTSSPVFYVDNSYYWCTDGTWLSSTSPGGPWYYTSTVPAAIYTIPASHPAYNVTYVTVQSATPTTVVYSQTSGYSGEYVAATGVVMFGMGMVAGAILADDDWHHHHYYYPPYYYSYGRASVYHHGYGGYVSHYGYGGYAARTSVAYGPYGGAGRTTAYNYRTGTYSRGGYAYGPGGNAGYRQAYNPYTGGYAERSRVNTAYGSAGRFYAEQGGRSVQGGSRSGAYGSAAGVRSNTTGAGAARWDTARGQGAVARDRSGNVYAGRNGNVYKKDDSGNWSQRSGSNWQSTAPSRSLESQAQARNWGNSQSARVNQARSSGYSRPSGSYSRPSGSYSRPSGAPSRSRGGGGGRRR